MTSERNRPPPTLPVNRGRTAVEVVELMREKFFDGLAMVIVITFVISAFAILLYLAWRVLAAYHLDSILPIASWCWALASLWWAVARLERAAKKKSEVKNS